jgi:hypothetical protein
MTDFMAGPQCSGARRREDAPARGAATAISDLADPSRTAPPGPAIDLARTATEITDRESWLALRSRDLTASRIAALFGKHPFLSREQLAAQLRGGARHFDNVHMRAGRILEPGVAVAIGEARPDWKIVKATAYYQLPDRRLGCTPDYFVGDDGLIQIGTISAAEWRGKPPLYKVVQTLTELIVTGRPRGYLAIMVRSLPELPLHLFEVPRRPEAEHVILSAAAAWWRAWAEGSVAPLAPLSDIGEVREVIL